MRNRSSNMPPRLLLLKLRLTTIILQNNTAVMEKILSDKTLDTPMSPYGSAVLTAARSGNPEALKLLFKKLPMETIQAVTDHRKNTLLHSVNISNNKSVIYFCLDQPQLSLVKTGWDGHMPLGLAVSMSQTDVIERFLMAGIHDTEYLATALHGCDLRIVFHNILFHAAEAGRTGVMQCVLEYAKSSNTPKAQELAKHYEETKEQILRPAARKGYFGIVELIMGPCCSGTTGEYDQGLSEQAYRFSFHV
ncbi:hypothetical protein BDV19DRAFT_244230 [Aspergillus venezuelensis]